MSEQSAAVIETPSTSTEIKTDQTTPETTTSPKPDAMASKFAALAKKERHARLLQAQAKARHDELAKREAAVAERERMWNEEFKSNPLEALKRRNLTYQDLTNAALNDGKFQPDVEIKRVQDDIQRLRQENEEKEKKTLEDQKRAAEQNEKQTISEYREGLKRFISSNPEKYEFTNRYDPEAHMVWDTIEEHWERGRRLFELKEGPPPKVLSREEAADLVESYYEAEIEKELDELPKTKKFQSKWSGKFLNKASEERKDPPRSTTTLSNNLSSSSAPSLLPQKTEEDRLKRALAALG